MTLRVGIQGAKGSSNEKACLFFAEKYKWNDLDIEYLISTQNVLSALHKGTIDLGTFAWESTSGLVEETQQAVQKYDFEKIDEVILFPDHALLGIASIDPEQMVHIFSHPQALIEHRPFLSEKFPHLNFHAEIDTAVAAEKMKKGTYPKNSLVIAPKDCAKIYGLELISTDLPANKNYRTTIYLVQKKSLL